MKGIIFLLNVIFPGILFAESAISFPLEKTICFSEIGDDSFRKENRFFASELIKSKEDFYSPLRDSLPLKVRYKKIDSTELYLYIYYPPAYVSGEKHPAIVFFFGGGWIGGSVQQFAGHAKYFASRGMVAMTAEYRVKSRNHTTPFDAVRDAKSAIRFIRAYADVLGVDPHRIVASGGSAGGHIAAAAGIIKGLEESGEDTTVSSRPDALVLFNPVFDNGPGGYGYDRIGERYREISPFHNIAPGDPPAILFFGTRDQLVPVKTIKAFQKKMQAAGNRCDLFLYEGEKHGFFNYSHPEYYKKTIHEADKFLTSLGFLSAKNSFSHRP
ncbi:MAG TPA: alpha/beta hydrolase [Bacteroidetes bacterium]|nr:alpha/beta hydrolase [Bacteroidota bacterium]